MTIYQDIRGALQSWAVLTPGFPPAGQRSYEGVLYNSVVGVRHARMTLMPSSDRPPFMKGKGVQHEGLFQVDLFEPTGDGSAPVEQMADRVCERFYGGLRLPTNAGNLLIRYSERSPILMQPDWLQISVTIGYRIYSKPV